MRRRDATPGFGRERRLFTASRVRAGARQRGDHRRPLGARRLPGGAQAAAAVGAPDHCARRPARSRARRARRPEGASGGRAAASLGGARRCRLDWPEGTMTMQRSWIGRSEGAEIAFATEGGGEDVRVFTTRADTLMGATYVVVAPEHPLARRVGESDSAVAKYIAETARRPRACSGAKRRMAAPTASSCPRRRASRTSTGRALRQSLACRRERASCTR